MRCHECATENSDDSNFCMTCGSLLGAEQDSTVAVEEAPVTAIDGQGEESSEASDSVGVRDGSAPGDKNPWLPDADDVSPSVDSDATESGLAPSGRDGAITSEDHDSDAIGTQMPPASSHGVAAEVHPDFGSASTSTDATFTESPGQPRPDQSYLPPPPPATDQSWTPPSPPLGIPPSLMPPTGEIPEGQAHPPASGSFEPIPQAQGAPPAAPQPPAAHQGQVAPESPEAVVMDVGPSDPHGLDNAMARLNPVTRPHAEIPVLIAAARLRADEQVDLVVPGLVAGVVGVAVVTSQRVLLVNSRQWSPVVVEYAMEAGLEVHGWQDETYAQLTFRGATVGRLESIIDHSLAFDAARLIRERVPTQGL